MNCEEAMDIVRSGEQSPSHLRMRANEHLRGCSDCKFATLAFVALEADRRVPAPPLRPGSFEHALRRAAQRPTAVAARRRGFWLGAGVGAALAASVLLAAIAVWLQRAAPESPAYPEVSLTLNEARDVSVSIDSPAALPGAEIRVVLTGAVALQGFDGQRELRWMTDLDSGVNQLTLPLVVIGAGGGQVTVEVQHGEKLRTFVLDVQAKPNSSPTV
jgi:hypothetical protein